MLLLEAFKILLTGLEIFPRPLHLLWLVVEHDEVSALEVESVQLVAGLLRVHRVLEDDESSALRVCRYASTNLAVRNRQQ